MDNNLPRLLLVSEVSLNKECTGISRTLINLFESYPKDNFMLFSSDKILKSYPVSPPFERNVASFSDKYLPTVNNRLSSILNPLINILNLQLRDLLPFIHLKQIINFSPDIVLICPNGPLGLISGYRIAQVLGLPFLIYFMDDWMQTCQASWITGNIQSLCRLLLQKAEGWLVISSQLEKDLSQRYQVSPSRSLTVHNPVDLSNKSFPSCISYTSRAFQVAYAGAIWPMHYDAIAVIAEAIYELRQEGLDIELVLYTFDDFWGLYREYWENWQVKYGSLIPYQELNGYLQRADLLLVASSFMPEHAHITRSSVQTKLTDYMASGRLMLSCGPNYAACNKFVKVWNCGLVCETNCVEEVKTILLKIINDYKNLNHLAYTAYTVIKDNFEINVIRSNLYRFIQESI
jgi:glycosyltransferase involved in cell wall biosynthesis